ncbi:hypothetical protein [Xylella fastidiosa]|uniref:hypothetical protein n=1 Tax=Xylella fastidiosa TaxID=2371 RepID=UPI000FEC5A66|nr:hypothetical protein [Xylella fastidiosa]WLE28209.1 hypothetical protein DVS74_005070 [Xylella fastidiosa subsp. multiplex]
MPFVVDEDNWFFLNAMGEIHNGGSPSSLLLFLNVFLVFDCRSLGDDSVGVAGPSQGVWPEVFQFCTAHQHISTSAHQHISTSAHQHISTSAHQHISTSGDVFYGEVVFPVA